MDHQQAVAAGLAERYAYKDLIERERDEFEDHLADCSRCMEDVRTAQVLAANAHAVFTDEADAGALDRAQFTPSPPWWRSRFAFTFSGGLNLALAGLAIYAFVAIIPLLRTQIDALQAPAASESFVIQGTTRGAAPAYSVLQGSSATFRLDLPRPFRGYVCVLEDASKHTRKTYNLRGTGSLETLTLTIPTAALDPGEYHVLLSGLENSTPEVLADFMLRVRSHS